MPRFYFKIAVQLNSDGVPTRSGKRWHGVVINRILTGATRARLN
jgi:hypothetical protein